MTVRELLERLKDLDPNLPIYLHGDDELRRAQSAALAGSVRGQAPTKVVIS